MDGDGEGGGRVGDDADVVLVAEGGVRSQGEVATGDAVEFPEDGAFFVEGDDCAEVAERGEVAVTVFGDGVDVRVAPGDGLVCAVEAGEAEGVVG